MKMLQAIAQRRDGKWFASIATQEGVVLEGSGESLVECIDNAINGSVSYETCFACNGLGMLPGSDDPDVREVPCEICEGSRTVSDDLALELCDSRARLPYSEPHLECEMRAVMFAQAAREMRRRAREMLRRARKLGATKSPLDPITFADVVRAVTP